MILIRGDSAVPFAGGIQHELADGVTSCGLTESDGDLTFKLPEQARDVWVALCKRCYA